jgi:hypothetical protein
MIKLFTVWSWAVFAFIKNCMGATQYPIIITHHPIALTGDVALPYPTRSFIAAILNEVLRTRLALVMAVHIPIRHSGDPVAAFAGHFGETSFLFATAVAVTILGRAERITANTEW